MHILEKLTNRKVIQPPAWMPLNVHYLVIGGSESYGVSSGGSDVDIKGICIPPKQILFPHFAGKVPGFDWPTDKEMKQAGNWQSHHNFDSDSQKEYDIDVRSITRFFQLAANCNPDIVDTLFVPSRCILHQTVIGQKIRENRHLFLSKLGWNTFKGYAYQQMHRMMKDKPEGKRVALVEKFGFDVKFAYHIVRLLNEIEQILTTGDLDIEVNREQLKSIRRGEWTKDEIISYSKSKERELEKIKNESDLPEKPNRARIKDLLLHCLEVHYGSMESVITNPDKDRETLNIIKRTLEERM